MLDQPIHMLHKTAEKYPDKAAIVLRNICITYADLVHSVESYASFLKALSIGKNERIFICLGNEYETILSFLAAWSLQACPCILPAKQETRTFKKIVENSCPRLIVCTKKNLKQILDLGYFTQPFVSNLHDVLGSDKEILLVYETLQSSKHIFVPWPNFDPYLLVYTSGSTGIPKGVTMGYPQILAACQAITAYLGLTAQDRILNFLPLSFDYGLYQLILSIFCGATLFLEESFINPALILRHIDEFQVTVLPVVPLAVHLLSDFKKRISVSLNSIRLVTNTGDTLTRQHIKLIKGMLPEAVLFSMYGLTECKRCTYVPPKNLERKPGSVGIGMPNLSVFVLYPDGTPCRSGEVGEIAIKSLTLMKGYWGDYERTNKRIKQHPKLDRLLLTGDFGYLDQEGYLYLMGRQDHVVKRHGNKVFVLEIERKINSLNYVLEAVIIPTGGQDSGIELCLFLISNDSIRWDELIEILQKDINTLLPPYARPSFGNILKRFPMNENGKIDRLGLKKMAEEMRSKNMKFIFEGELVC